MRLGIDSKGEPMLRLYDDIYKPRLEIGKTELKNTKTGSTEIRSTGSIVIYDEKGKVIYSVP
jgi:thioredoxin-related protein